MGTVKLDLDVWGCVSVCSVCAKAASQLCNCLLSTLPCRAGSRLSCCSSWSCPQTSPARAELDEKVENSKGKLLANVVFKGKEGETIRTGDRPLSWRVLFVVNNGLYWPLKPWRLWILPTFNYQLEVCIGIYSLPTFLSLCLKQDKNTM